MGEGGAGAGAGAGGGGDCLKLDVQVQGGGKILDINGQGLREALKIRQFSWASYVHRSISVNQLIFFPIIPV